MEINKKILSNSLKIALLILIFYYPYQIVKYYLTDFTYADIVDYEWRMDNICSLSPCPEGLTSFEGECSIKHDGYLYYNKTPIGKVIEMKKPNYFTSGEIITGGSLKIQNLISGKICKYDSVI